VWIVSISAEKRVLLSSSPHRLPLFVAELSTLPQSGWKRLTRLHRPKATAPQLALGLGGSDQIGVQHHANLAAQQIKQDGNALTFGHALEQAETR
jgi:hypothetical protein